MLGTNRFAKSFIYKCKQGCRTFADQYRNLHSKFYTFTQAGKSKDVMAIGSVNLTRNADLPPVERRLLHVRQQDAVPPVRQRSSRT